MIDYKNYLKSERWRQLKQVYKKDHCYCCDSDFKVWDASLHLHHKSYKNLNTDKEGGDLITLCELCHHVVHKLIKYQNVHLETAHKHYWGFRNKHRYA